MKIFLGTLFLFLLIFTNCYADKKFDKDLKKVSKLNGFVDSKGAIYSIEQISNKENTILILYNHGSGNDQVLDKCSKPWNKTPPVLLGLHDKKINNFQIKIYHLCSGVRGWTQDEQGRMWQAHVDSGKLSLTLVDNNGTPLIQRQKQLLKQKIIKKKVDDLKEKGFENIVLAGHSAGAWASITLKSKFPENIDGVIATNTTLDRSGLKSSNKDQTGGLSGVPLRNKSTEIIKFLSEKSNKDFQELNCN